MRFKYWLYINEAISPNDKEHVLNSKLYTNEKDATIKNKIDQLLTQLESDPQNYTKGDIFKKIQEIIPISNKKTGIATKKITEDAFRKNWETRGSTEDELKTYDFYKNENKEQLQEMMELLRKFIQNNIIKITFENNKPIIIRTTLQGEEKLEAPDFTRFLSNLHGIDSSLNQYKVGKHLFNPILEEKKYENYLTKGDNVWVFRGDTPDLCRTFGKGQIWCISSSTSASHWFSYRIDYHQTQYFVFDFNKDENDPARYVNPGVAPEGMYSEWVDAINKHSKDPEDPRSQIGINGYTSINQYKQYLVSKGIPLKTWETTEPDKWEERLAEYDNEKNFSGAKNDSDPRVFPLYLKVVPVMRDQDFNTLSNDEKIEFVMSKIENLTEKQFDFAKRVSGYYNSLQFDDKVKFAAKTDDIEKIENLAKNPDLSDDNVGSFLYYASNKQEIAKLIIQKKPELSEYKVKYLLYYASDSQEIAKLIIVNKPELSGDNVKYLLHYASDKQEIAKLIIEKKLEISDNDVENLLHYASDKQEIAKLIIEKKPKLSDDNVKNLLSYPPNTAKQEIAKLIIQKKLELSVYKVKYLLNYASDKQEIAKIIIEKKPKLSDNDVENLIYYASERQEIAKLIIEKKPELSDDNVYNLIRYAIDRQEIAKLIIEKKPKLSDRDFVNLLDYAFNKQEIAKLIIEKQPELHEYNADVLLRYASDEQEIAELIIQKQPELEAFVKSYVQEKLNP